jgi:MFS family permease
MASPTITVKPRRAFHGWRILAFATLTAALTGPGQTVGVSVFIDHIIEDLSLTRSQVSSAYLIGTMLGALSLPTVGRWVDKVGARPAITAIGAGFAIALVGMSGVGGFVTLAVGFTFIRFLGQGSLSLASTVAVTHWFERRRGLAIGIYATFTSMLMGLTPVGLNFVIENSTWRTAWVVAGIFIALTVIPIGRFGIISYPADIGEVPDGHVEVAKQSSNPVPRTRSYTRTEASRTWRFWVLLAGSASAGMLATALNFHQISLLGEAGMSSGTAALMFLPQVVGSSVAALVFGALTDRISARVLMPLTMIFLAGALLLAGVVAPGWIVIVYALTLGLAGGSTRSVTAALLPKWFGVQHIGSIQGLMTFAGVAASALGPVAFSLGRDWLGDYTATSFAWAALPAAVAVVAALSVGPQRTRRAPN